MIDAVFSFNLMLYLTIPAAFLLGSIPFGIVFTKSKGIDLTGTGSKNIGATNVLRTAGKLPALLTLICDMLKGTLAVFICKMVITSIDPGFAAAAGDFWLGIAALAAVSGHMFSVFLSFRGGKGVATGFGVMLVYSPAVAGIMFLVWVSTAIIFRYSSLAAIITVIVMPVVFILFNASMTRVIIGVLLALLIVFKHRSNIMNLIAGTESRISDKAKAGE